jgi:hypothetical protein
MARRGGRAQEHRAGRASAQGVKLGNIGARQVSGGPFGYPADTEYAFIFRRFRRFQQAEKGARHQVVWSCGPAFSSLSKERINVWKPKAYAAIADKLKACPKKPGPNRP